jgi:hypothetical protein
MSQVRSISLHFPENAPEQQRSLRTLQSLPLPVVSTGLEGLLPRFEINASHESHVSLHIDGDSKVALSGIAEPGARQLGVLEEIAESFRGHVRYLDHCGVNLPAEDTSGSRLLDILSHGSKLYRYPNEQDPESNKEGPPWYFVVPATAEEFQGDFSALSKVRCPKFELVIDGGAEASPLIQFDFATNLSRQEVERRLPQPIGVTFAGLESFFRSVFVQHPWSGFHLRLDFRYMPDNPINPWSTGEFLVKYGTRRSS